MEFFRVPCAGSVRAIFQPLNFASEIISFDRFQLELCYGLWSLRHHKQYIC